MSQATVSPRHAACEHLDVSTCSYCDTDTVFFFIFPPNATLRERMTGTLIDVIRHGGAHRAQPVSLAKAVAAGPAHAVLPRHLFAR